MITSLDWVKQERPLRMLREALPTEVSYPRAFDMLVIDEVHNVAPSATGKYATDSLRTQAIRDIAPHLEHRLFFLRPHITVTRNRGRRCLSCSTRSVSLEV